MKSKLLMFIATLVAGTGASVMQAQNVIPYLPMQDNFGGTAIITPNDFSPSSGDYTLEVNGTMGTEISIAKDAYRYVPTATGKVRFAQKSGKVIVYEGDVYKATLIPNTNQGTFPDITDTDAATNPVQLLENNSFETTGSLVSGATDRWKFGTPWISNVTEASSYIRIGNNNKAVNGSKVLVWRGSGNTNYITQPLTSIKPNKLYKVQIRQVDSGNANATFNVGFGSTYSGMEYGKSTVKLGTNYNGTQTAIINTSGSVEGTVYFTLSNTTNNTASSGSDPVTQIDYISLVEGVNPTGIEGASNPVYLEGAAYAPELTMDYAGGDYFDMTYYIDNPSFETGILGTKWVTNGTGDTGVKPNSNTTYTTTGIDGNYLFNTWNNSNGGNLEQTITNLPNGTYTMVTLVASDKDNTYTAFLNKAQSSTTITGDKSIFQEIKVENVNVTDHTVKLGINAGKWYKADHFRLYFYGYDPTIAISDLNQIIATANGLRTQKMYTNTLNELTTAISQAEAAITSATEEALTNANTTIATAITNANTSIDSYAKLQTAIDEATAYKTAITTPSEEAKTTFENEISAANAIYTGGSVENTETVISTLKSAQRTYMIAQPERPLNLTSILANPSFEDGNDPYNCGWNLDRGTTGSFDFKFITGQNPTDGARILNAWAAQIHHINLSQEVILPAGVYTLKGDIRTDQEPIDQHIAATINGIVKKSPVIKYDSNVEGGWQSAANWNNLQVEFVVLQETKVTLGVYSTGLNISGNSRGWFQADNFQLYYLGEGTITSNNDTVVTVKGKVNTTDLNAVLTTETTSLDATEADINGEIVPANPNTIVYGLPAGATLQQGKGISEGSTASLNDTYSFHAPKSLIATVYYTRAFNTNGQYCNQTNGNWQTICLPFDVTAVKAKQSGNEISLIPISGFTGTEGTNDPRPFWVYEIGTDNKLNPATEMKANVPYLVAIPNDASTYRDFYNVSGDVTFSGTQILVTNPETGTTGTYSMTANFNPITANANDYGINTEGTYFVPSVDIKSFNAKVAPVGTGKPAYLPIFGDDSDLTSLPAIPSAELQNGIEVYTSANGVTIQSEKEVSLSIFEVSGKLVKEIRINEGLNYVTLPAGQYVINGSVIIVK